MPPAITKNARRLNRSRPRDMTPPKYSLHAYLDLTPAAAEDLPVQRSGARGQRLREQA